MSDAMRRTERAIDSIGGKWKFKIILALRRDGVLRYGQIRDCLGGISDAVLASSLRDLQRDGMVVRQQYQTMPPRVEYFLTQKGEKAHAVIKELVRWAVAYDWPEETSISELSACDFHSPV